ncbi:hypothetical protein [Xenorhabdus miraniensis]|nr:hypothetical protein [Xenorhabdus miraniensis]
MKLIEVFRDSYVFEEQTVLGKKQLTIVCHGTTENPNNTYAVVVNNNQLGPAQLSQNIHNWVRDVNNLQRVRLAACMSANPEHGAAALNTSFASQLSALLPNTYVRGYVREVTTTLEPNALNFFYQMGGCDIAQEGVANLFRMMREDLTRHYHSIVFLNGMVVRQTINGHDFQTLEDNGIAGSFDILKYSKIPTPRFP